MTIMINNLDSSSYKYTLLKSFHTWKPLLLGFPDKFHPLEGNTRWNLKPWSHSLVP